MAVDIRHNKDRWMFLSLRTNAPFNKVILKRLFMRTANRPPFSVSRLIRKMFMIIKWMIQEIPKLKICTLRLPAGPGPPAVTQLNSSALFQSSLRSSVLQMKLG
uniref:Large ribosomal subunit protein uL15/eL18 domain-containing protein n=1 Tax=Oryzias melastigma TaxID=30732 RepID=A0A3B3DW64_ORYME